MDSTTLEAIEARALAAQPGPFAIERQDVRDGAHSYLLRRAGHPGVALMATEYSLASSAELFAHARQDVLDLVDEVRRLSKEGE